MTRRRWLAILVAAVGVGAGPVLAGPASGSVRVLLYHRVGDSRYPSTNVSVEAFRAQMRWLGESGYSVVSTEALARHLLEGAPLPDRAVVIQFDDGYRSVYAHAFPILRELGYPFCVFLPTEALDRGYNDYMTWDMARAMVDGGGELGAHGHRHLRLGRLAGEEGRARIREELGEGARRLRAQGVPPRWVAYPYGEYSPAVLEEARRLGFSLGFTQDPGAVPPGADPLALPRFAVVGDLGDLATFRERVGYCPLPLEDRVPPPGPLATDAPEGFAARIADPRRYAPGTQNLFVSELGRLPAAFDPATGWVRAPFGGRLTRRLNRVLLSVRDRESGAYCLGSWAILLGPESP
ncbi:MAG: hypothetical protein Kow0092_02780 [Deferrisomatales bacterium]